MSELVFGAARTVASVDAVDSEPVRTLGSWRARFESLDWCPWPGPRPLRTSDAGTLLVGRDEEKARFRREVRDRRLVFLTGATGVGKTSLLEAGLAPELARAGFTVAICRDWSGSARQNRQAVHFLAEKVRAQLAGYLKPEDRGADVFWKLNSTLGGKCVLILDQFEELIRDAPLLTAAIYKLIALLNERTALRLVVSFRSEYLHEISDLEKAVKPQTMSHMALAPIADTFAYDVITAPNPSAQAVPAEGALPPPPQEGTSPDEPRDGEVITETAARECAERWQRALETTAVEALSSRTGRVGLLHLQALLYVLSEIAGPGMTVDLEHVAKLDERHAADKPSWHEFFIRILQASVDTKVSRCQQASADLDRYLVDGTTRLLAEAAPHLSSAGYKLIRDVRDLAASALGDDLDALRRGLAVSGHHLHEPPDGAVTDTQIDGVIDWMLGLVMTEIEQGPDLLTVERSVVAEAVDAALARDRQDGDRAARIAGESRPWTGRLHAGGDPRAVDRATVTSGPMLGLSPAAVLFEELRRFAFAVEWLRVSSLARLSTPGLGGANMALIHDGFGTALEQWSKRTADDARGVLSAFTAPSGASLIWKNPTDCAAVTGTQAEPVILVNLRWRGAWVSGDFTHVAFVNCDLRGAGFNDCHLEGVSFINCLLDGAMFSDCTVINAPAAAQWPWDRKAPSFSVPVSAGLRASLERYRDGAPAGTGSRSLLLSPVSGRAAVPLGESAEAVLPWQAEPGGVVIYGGRVSSLTVRGTSFVGQGQGQGQGGRLAFRHMAGSGLELVEQRGGEIEVHGSALRHLTISGPVGDRESALHDVTGTDDQLSAVTVHIAGSSLVQTFVADGLRGTVDIQNSSIMQFWNNAAGVRATAVESSFLDVVNVDLSRSTSMVERDMPVALDSIRAIEDVAKRLRRMDYRRDASFDDVLEENSDR